MNFYEYIGKTPQEFEAEYVETGLVARQRHREFPLDIFAYGRKAVSEQLWDGVTSRCRGIIVNRETGEVVARPFEKFHNFGSSNMPETDPAFNIELFKRQPVIWEKLDGFMCTLYTWDGVDYLASKGSFHSVHAKWATAWYRNRFGKTAGWPTGYTPVFEGLCQSLRIVVDYKEREELVLLGLINIEGGGEYIGDALDDLAVERGLTTPDTFTMSWQEARDTTIKVAYNEEGYVMVWDNPDGPPTRLKLKYIEYLRLHRMVTGVSPKRVWEVLSSEQTAELTEWLKQSTPWFSHFVNKWTRVLETEYSRIAGESHTRFQCADIMVKAKGDLAFHELRKAYALEFMREDNKEFAPVLFAMLDGKDIQPVIWKLVKRLTNAGQPMIDSHSL